MELETESLTISIPGFYPGMRCKNDFTSPIRSDQFQCNTRLSLTLLRGRIRALHAGMGTQRWGDVVGGGGDVYLQASFLSSSLCLCLLNRSGYSYQADTRAALGSTYLFPKMAPLYVVFFFFFFFSSLIKAILMAALRRARRSDFQLCIYELGYRDDSHTGEMAEQTITGVCSMASVDPMQMRNRAPLYNL